MLTKLGQMYLGVLSATLNASGDKIYIINYNTLDRLDFNILQRKEIILNT